MKWNIVVQLQIMDYELLETDEEINYFDASKA